MINDQFLTIEASKFRYAINACNKDASTVITNEFPIGNCKFASIFLAFHYRKRWSGIEIVCVSGFSGNGVSHVWLEIGGYVIDITGDQYNIMNDDVLNSDVIKYRPYPSVYVDKISESYLYQLFGRTERLILNDDFSNFKKTFVNKLEYSYSLIQNELEISRSEINANNLP